MFAKINNTLINLEIADTKAKSRKGLSGRKSLDKNSGMLFIFEGLNPSIQTKDMLFPLDLLFVDAKGIIKDITQAKPGNNLFQGEGKYVIEMNKGFTKDNDINTGDKVEFLKSFYIPDRYSILPKKKNLNGGTLNNDMMHIVEKDGKIKKSIPNNSRIISRKETKKLISLASKANDDKKLMELGKLMVNIINGQDKRKPEFVYE